MSALEDYLVEDYIKYKPAEEQEQRRDQMRVELMRYNGLVPPGSADLVNDEHLSPEGYLEPNSDGIYPGLEDGFVE